MDYEILTSQSDELLYMMALTRMPQLSYVVQNRLLEEAGTATAVYTHRAKIMDVVADATDNLRDALVGMDSMLKRCREELAFADRKQIQCIARTDARYPERLRHVPDAPLVLYYLGSAQLNAPHVVSMVGTRQCTEYGKDLCRRFVSDLKALVPDVLILSGLAYGIDVNAHRAALDNALPTVGVLAHGLDMIYPSAHRETARQMLRNGGLLTEYMSRTAVDRRFFLARNRIVAGMADATIVVESASHGGSLVTARLAMEYDREVFTFPGRITDEQSAGCNNLLVQGKAHCITSAADFVSQLGWTCVTPEVRQKGIQRQIFPQLTADERRIVDALRGSDGKQVNQLIMDTGLSVGTLSSLLFELEMKGVVRLLCGSSYRLVEM